MKSLVAYKPAVQHDGIIGTYVYTPTMTTSWSRSMNPPNYMKSQDFTITDFWDDKESDDLAGDLLFRSTTWDQLKAENPADLARARIIMDDCILLFDDYGAFVGLAVRAEYGKPEFKFTATKNLRVTQYQWLPNENNERIRLMRFDGDGVTVPKGHAVMIRLVESR